MTLESDDLPDEMDLASSEYLQSFTFRLRGREKTFLQKIDHALERIDDGRLVCASSAGEPTPRPSGLRRDWRRRFAFVARRIRKDGEGIRVGGGRFPWKEWPGRQCAG